MGRKIRLSEAALSKMIKESVLAELDRRKVMPAKYYDIFKSRVINAMHGRFGEVERVVTEFYKDFRDRIPSEDFTFESLMELAEKIEDRDNSAGREWGNAEGHKVKNAEGWWAINKGKFLEEGKVRLNESRLKKIIKESVKKVLRESYGSCSCRLVIDGCEFASYFPDEVVDNDEAFQTIATNEFDCRGTRYWDTGDYWSPPDDDFEVTDDDGLYELIEQVKDPEVRKKLFALYTELIEKSDDWEGPDYWEGPDDYDDDPDPSDY